MNIKEKILNDPTYLKMLSALSPEEREVAEKQTAEMIDGLDIIHAAFINKAADQSGSESLIDELVYLFSTKEGNEQWLPDKN